MGGPLSVQRAESPGFLQATRHEPWATPLLGVWKAARWGYSWAYLLLERVRVLLLPGAEYAQATVGTVRAKVVKVAALVTVSVRRVYVQLSSAYPWQSLFRQCQARAMGLMAAQT
jgi:hypothetical protein